MAASKVVQARVPSEIQETASAVIQASGLTVSDMVRVLMTRIAHDGAVPLELFAPSAETLTAFREARSGQLQRFDSVDALFDDLND